MNEDQARTILRKVREYWSVTDEYLLELTADELREDMGLIPPPEVSLGELEQAISRRRTDPRWAE